MKFLIFLLFCFCSLSVLAQNFLPQTDDIPQIQGLEKIEEVANFDTPQERLLILNATSSKTISEIQNYYQTTLKNLGWHQIQKNTFQRGKDTFKIEAKKINQKTKIQFILTQE